MGHTTEGIVLRKVAHTSTREIATIYTRSHGMVPFAVRLSRSRKTQGPSMALIQPLMCLELVFDFRQKSEIQLLQSFNLAPMSNLLNEEPQRAAVSLFLAEILFKSLREESPDVNLYDFISASLEYYFSHPFNPDFHLIFLARLTRFLGFSPSGVWSAGSPILDLQMGTFLAKAEAGHICSTPDQGAILYRLTTADYTMKIPEVNRAVRRELLELIVQYYKLHLEGIGQIKSLGILRDVYA